MGQTSGNVQVSASYRVNVVLSDGSTSLGQGSGTDFVVGAANFDNIAIEAFDENTSVALRLIGAETSTAGSVPSWYDQVGYVMGGNDRGASKSLVMDKYLATARTWSVATPLPVTMYESRGCSNRGVAGYACSSDLNGANYSDDVEIRLLHDHMERSFRCLHRGEDETGAQLSGSVARTATHATDTRQPALARHEQGCFRHRSPSPRCAGATYESAGI